MDICHQAVLRECCAWHQVTQDISEQGTEMMYDSGGVSSSSIQWAVLYFLVFLLWLCRSGGVAWPLVLVKLRFTRLAFPSYIQGSDYLLPLNVAGAVRVRSSVLRGSLSSYMEGNL